MRERKRRCAKCQEPFGLVSYRKWFKRFCSRQCKREYVHMIQEEYAKAVRALKFTDWLRTSQPP